MGSTNCLNEILLRRCGFAVQKDEKFKNYIKKEFRNVKNV